MKDKIRTRKTPKPKTSGAKRKWAEAALRESERRKADEIKEKGKYFLQLIKNAPIAMAVDSGVDEDEKGIMLNKKFTELFGYTAEDVPDVQHWWALAYPDVKYREEVRAEWVRRVEKAVRACSEIEPMETQVTCNDGSIRYIKVYLASIGDKNLVTFEDLTGRKKAEELLRRREEQYRTLVENIPDYVMQYDRQHRHIFANTRTLRDNKKTAEEFIGKTHREIGFAPDLCDIWEKAIDKVFETGQPQTEVFEWESSVGVKVLEWRVYPEFASDGSIETVLGISRDITEQRQAEKALKESEARYRIVADKTYDWEFWLSPEGKFIYTSPSCKNTTGYAKEEFMADPSLLRNIIHPEERLNFDNHRHKAVQEKKLATIVFRIICRDGTLRWIDHICQPVFDEDGRFLGTRGSNRDITERKKAEEEREKIILELKDALAEVKQLSGMLPICASCKKIRDDKGYWRQIEVYIRDHSEAEFTHGLCPDCEKKAYEELDRLKKERDKN